MRERGGIEFGLLGPVTGRLDGTLLDLGPPKQRFVLAVLLLDANRTVTTERLVDLSWPDAPPRSARTAIHGRISRLRAVLAAADRHGVVLDRAGSGYVLRVDPALVDAHRFTALLGEARAARTDELAAERYDQALALWRGPALDGAAPEDVRRELCGNLEEARLLAVDELADVRLRLGRHRDLVEHLTSHLAAHPTRERTARQLALALYRCGHPTDALDVCRRTRRQLHDDLGIDPGPELRALEVAILRNDEALAPPRPDTAAAAAVPAHLPAATAGFTGRAAELRRLTELLADGDPAVMPIAVISGPAGVGKSALAVHCGHTVAPGYPDGQLHVDLRGYDLDDPVPPTDALTRFLRALGVPPAQVPVDQDEAVLAYRSLLAGRRVLVVLDNAGSAEQVRPLLPGAASCAVLVTSRDDLRGLTAIDGARPLPLDVLTPAESLALLGRMVGADRLAAAPAAAAELAELCGHLPLALRIAGAHLASRRAQPVEEYARALAEGNRLGQLAIPEDPRAAVGTAFDLSYRTLTPPSRLLFRRLGLVPGPDFTPAMAAEVARCAPAEAEEELARLTAAHLVREHVPGRYQFHALIRHYAAARAEDEEPPAEHAAVVTGLRAFYLRHADAAARVLYPHRLRLPLPDQVPVSFTDTTTAVRWLDVELPNLTAAVHQAARTGARRTAGLLADALRGYFPGRGLGTQWLDIANTALTAAREEGDPSLAASAHLSLGEAYAALARYPPAAEHYERARTAAREANWPDGESSALGNLGTVHREAGDLRQAADSFAAALEINVRIGSRRKQVVDLMNLGVTSALLGRLAAAADLFARAEAATRDAGSPGTTAMVAQCRGNVERCLGRLEEAEAHLTTALQAFRELGDVSSQASVLDSLAAVHTDAGRWREASDLAEKALSLARKTDSPRVEAAALNTLGLVHMGLSAPESALARHTAALQLATAAGHVAAQVEALIGQATAHTHLNIHPEAATCAKQALDLARTTGHRMLEGQALTALARATARAGDPATGTELAGEALVIHRETGHLLGEARTHHLLGDIHHALGRPALPHWSAALTLFTKADTPEAAELRRLVTKNQRQN